MTDFETDYLIIGAGAMGLAFADVLIAESGAHVTIVDRHGKPGGHWNDAYDFVCLHQPSAFYGVNSMGLGSGEKDQFGPNSGLYELASGAEVLAYFDRVMRNRLLVSGRVRYLPMTEHVGAGQVRSLLSGDGGHITVRRKIVDATFLKTSTPSTHIPQFEVEPGVRLVPPNALPHLWLEAGPPPGAYVILGAGKTAMDTAGWLLNAGVAPALIHWVTPRDSWLLNRLHTQPGQEFFHEAIGGQLTLLQAMADAADLDDLFARLEAGGIMLRIDPSVKPAMFHYATISRGEVEALRAITQVIRLGRVRELAPGLISLEKGEVPVAPDALFIDCTASAVTPRPCEPVFQHGLIMLQMVRLPQPAFSAALIAHLEARGGSDEANNALCAPIASPERLEQYPLATMANAMNQFAWSQDKELRAWIRDCRLDGFGKVVAAVDPEDADKRAILEQFPVTSMRAIANIRARFAPAGADQRA